MASGLRQEIARRAPVTTMRISRITQSHHRLLLDPPFHAAWDSRPRRHFDASIVRLLRDDEESTRLKAAWALGNIGDSTAITAIRDALKAEQEQQVRRALIRALLHSGGRSESALQELLKSEDETVREAAVRGLVGRNAFDPWPWPWPRPRPFP